jgi:outer membrane murein-binding lipoprotein Lpp
MGLGLADGHHDPCKENHMSFWKHATLLAGVMALMTGCSSTKKHQLEIANKDKQIKALNSELGLLSEKNRQLTGEVEASRAQSQAAMAQVEASKNAQGQVGKVLEEKDQRLREKDQQIAYLRKLAEKKQQVKVVQAPAMAPSMHGGPVVRGPVSTGGGGPYHLRIISLPNNRHSEQVARSIASYLSSQGITGAIPRLSSGKHWVVDIGTFTSIRSSDASTLKEKVRGLRYRGIRQFKDAYYVPY